MNLNAYAAQRRLEILDDLQHGRPPREGEYSVEALKEAKVKGQPQLGTTRYEPHAILIEFIYPDPLSTSMVLTVKLPSPQRIVHLPVPTWVIESIWQGDVQGSFHFESDAQTLVEAFQRETMVGHNEKWFLPQAAKRRE